MKNVKILYRDQNLSLWGVPYYMREGQSPRDLETAKNTKGWIWLGKPGWWGSLSSEEQEEIQSFLDRTACVPMRHFEWCVVIPD